MCMLILSVSTVTARSQPASSARRCFSGVPLSTMCEMRGHYDHVNNTESDGFKQVKNSAYEIIEKKHATYYGIAMVVKRLCQAIVLDEKSIFPVSISMQGEYGVEGVVLRYARQSLVKKEWSVPCRFRWMKRKLPNFMSPQIPFVKQWIPLNRMFHGI